MLELWYKNRNWVSMKGYRPLWYPQHSKIQDLSETVQRQVNNVKINFWSCNYLCRHSHTHSFILMAPMLINQVKLIVDTMSWRRLTVDTCPVLWAEKAVDVYAVPLRTPLEFHRWPTAGILLSRRWRDSHCWGIASCWQVHVHHSGRSAPFLCCFLPHWRTKIPRENVIKHSTNS